MGRFFSFADLVQLELLNLEFMFAMIRKETC